MTHENAEAFNTSLPGFVQQEQDYSQKELLSSGSYYLYSWNYSGKEVVKGEVQTIDIMQETRGYRFTLQQQEQTTWYYNYTKHWIKDDDFARQMEEAMHTFREEKTYEWEDFLSAEDVAKDNLEKLLAYGAPPYARIVNREVAFSPSYNWYVMQQVARSKQTQAQLQPPPPMSTTEKILSSLKSFGKGVTTGIDQNMYFGAGEQIMGTYDDGTIAFQLGKIATDSAFLAFGTAAVEAGLAGHAIAVPLDVSGVGTLAGVGVHAGSAAAIAGGAALMNSGAYHMKNDGSELLQRMQGGASKGMLKL